MNRNTSPPFDFHRPALPDPPRYPWSDLIDSFDNPPDFQAHFRAYLRYMHLKQIEKRSTHARTQEETSEISQTQEDEAAERLVQPR